MKPTAPSSVRVEPGIIIPGSSPHAYFDALRSRPECHSHYSLRNDAQIRSLPVIQTWPDGTRDVEYVYPNDWYPRKQDAARVRIRRNNTAIKNTTVAPYNNNSIRQARMDMPPMVPGHTYLVVWDAWYGREWNYEIGGLETHKAFMFDGREWPNYQPGEPGYIAPGWPDQSGPGKAKIYWEINQGYQGNQEYPVAADEIAHLRVRHYASTLRKENNPNTEFPDDQWLGVPVGPNVTSGSTSNTPVRPILNQFNIKPEKWTRYWQLFEYGAVPNPSWNFLLQPVGGTLASLWAADEDREPVQIYDRLQITMYAPGVSRFWIEFNTSVNEVKPTPFDLVAYVRNVVMLVDVTYSQMPGILQKPVG